MLSGLRSDLVSARRSLFRNPAYSLLTTLCLALGIGATTAVFSVVNAFLLSPLPFEDPDRLIAVWMTVHGGDDDNTYCAPSLTELQRISRSVEVAAHRPVDLNLSLTGDPQQVQGAYATANLFDVLGLRFPHGRPFTDAEEEAEAAVCVVSESFWRDQLGSAPHVTSSAARFISTAGRSLLPALLRLMPIRTRPRSGSRSRPKSAAGRADWESSVDSRQASLWRRPARN